MIILTNNRQLVGGIAFNEISLTLMFANVIDRSLDPSKGKHKVSFHDSNIRMVLRRRPRWDIHTEAKRIPKTIALDICDRKSYYLRGRNLSFILIATKDGAIFESRKNMIVREVIYLSYITTLIHNRRLFYLFYIVNKN